jgi:ornithine decarboxylase
MNPFYDPDLVSAMVTRHGSPVVLFSRALLGENFRRLQEAFPRGEIFYAIKSNPHPLILETLKQLGSSFDVSTPGELDRVLEMGVAPERLLYTHPIKKPRDIAHARERGVTLFIADNVDELDKVAANAPGAELLLRMAVTNPYCIVDLSYKFGADPRDLEALVLRALDLGLKPRGVAFHAGSQSTNPYVYAESLTTIQRIYAIFAGQGVDMDLLDVGGGFPISYAQSVMPLEQFAGPIYQTMDRLFPSQRLLLEPGRFLSGTSAALVTTVVGRSVRNNTRWYYLDDGLYGTFSGQLYDQQKYQFFSFREGETSQCILAGPTCDSFDLISTEAVLPDLEIGDHLLVPHMGAYTTASASEFNLYPRAKTVAVD